MITPVSNIFHLTPWPWKQTGFFQGKGQDNLNWKIHLLFSGANFRIIFLNFEQWMKTDTESTLAESKLSVKIGSGHVG